MATAVQWAGKDGQRGVHSSVARTGHGRAREALTCKRSMRADSCLVSASCSPRQTVLATVLACSKASGEGGRSL